MTRKMTIRIILGILFFCYLSTFSFAQGDNSPDPTVNLGLLDGATVTGSVLPSDSGRGLPTDILYDPAIQGFRNKTNWQEYGVAYNKNIGPVSKDDPFYWEVEWPTAKNINYITCGGVYGNQLQPNTSWAVQIWENGAWATLAKAQDGWHADSLMGGPSTGGWLNDGILKWRGLEPVVTTKLRIIAYSDSDMVSIHFRARGGDGINIKDADEPTKAVMIQYLDFSSETADNQMDNMVNLGLLNEAVVSSNLTQADTATMPFLRGQPADILFDPVTNNFYNTNTSWAEFGYPFNYDAGYPTIDEGFYWQTEWPVPKKVNYFTWGGIYGNQPQPNTLWAVQYWANNDWVTVLEGVGGTLEEGVPGVDVDANSVWQTDTPIETNKFRLAVYSDGINNLFSYSLRGRGGSTQNWDETDSSFKAILVQYKDLTTAINSGESNAPVKFSLNQNYPNPFNPQTNIEFSIPEQGHVRLSVYNLLGQKVAVLVDEIRSAGSYKAQFDATNLSSGIYFYRLETNQQMLTKKMILLR